MRWVVAVLPGVLCLHTPMRSTIRDCNPFATNQPNKLNFGPVPIVILANILTPPSCPREIFAIIRQEFLDAAANERA